MEFYKFFASLEVDDIGTYPQCTYNRAVVENFPTIMEMEPDRLEPQIPILELKLNEGAKITSVISSSLPFGLVVNQNVKRILQRNNLPPHRFYPINILGGQNGISYFWFHYVIEDFFEVVDMKRSILKIIHITDFDKPLQLLTLEDELTIRDIKKDLSFEHGLKFHKIYFTEKIRKYDLYGMRYVEHYTFINEKLRKELEEEAFTGFEVKFLIGT